MASIPVEPFFPDGHDFRSGRTPFFLFAFDYIHSLILSDPITCTRNRKLIAIGLFARYMAISATRSR